MSIGKKIRELRLEHNLLQRELAKEIHIAPNTLSQFETGQANPSYEVLSLIADFFQCSTDYLLGPQLSADEQELLQIYQSLSPAHRSQVLEYARYFAEKSGAATRRKA